MVRVRIVLGCFLVILFLVGGGAVVLAGPVLVAHAGGAVHGWPDSNSLEALENAVASGFEYIELDMILTSDGVVVLNHNWENIANRIPGVANGVMSHEEFIGHRIFGRLTPLDLEGLIGFLAENPGPRIITDTKDTDYAALYFIAEYYPEFIYRFIPQAYQFADVARIRRLGFEDIILTIYMMPTVDRNPGRIRDFAEEQGLYAVVLPYFMATPYFLAQLNMNEMRHIVHTIDRSHHTMEFYEMGFYGVYTGFLAPGGDDGVSVRVGPPVRQYARRMADNMRGQGNVWADAIFYKLGVPAYVHGGEVRPVWAYYLMTAPFESPVTGLVYMTLRNFDPYIEERRWQADTGTLRIAARGAVHYLNMADKEIFLYRDMLFISQEIVERVFGFAVLRDGDYIVVVKNDRGMAAGDFFDAAAMIFENERAYKEATDGTKT